MEKNTNDNRDVREIDEIVFGIYSAEEIKRLAVCEVNSSKLCGSDKNTGYGTVYDPRMGTIENGKQCETCLSSVWHCPGHFGYINLNECIVHPLHYKRVVDFLRCFCIKCFKLLITKDQITLNNLNRLLGVKRFNKILEKLEKIDMCPHCTQPQPDIKYTATDNSIAMVYKQRDKEKSKISIVLPVDEIKNIFDNISVDDVKLLGFNPDLMQPKNLILTVFPVIPTCFVENTLILTNNGYKYIQDVAKDDLLYTHTGKFQKINDFQVKQYEGDMINMKTAYHPNIISCTPEHPFYVKEINIVSGSKLINGKSQYYKEKKIGEAKWVDAGDLNSNHFIGMKRNTKSIIPEFNFENTNTSKILNNHDEWVLLGYYVRNGWLNLKGRFYLSLHDKDTEFVSGLLNKLNITCKVDTGGSSQTFDCYNIILWNIFKEFGDLGQNKKIPSWVQDAPKEYIQSFLDGYCKTDDHNHTRNQIQLETVSTDLTFSVQLLYMKLGKLAGIHNNKMVIVKERTKDLNIYLIEDDYIWFKITKKETTSVKDIKVYNFEVNKDNSYCVENLICHNCCRPYIISESNICDDDLTIQLVEIIKANNHLKIEEGVPVSETKRQKYLQSLKFRIATFYNNSCLAPDTPVLMWEGGFKRADEIEYGDELIGDDGEKRIVQSTCSGEDEMFEVEQRSGEKYVVNSNHYLTLKHKRHKKIIWQKPSKDYTNGKWVMYYFNGLEQKVKNIQISETLTREEAFIKMEEFSDTIDASNIFDIKIKDYTKFSKNVKENLIGFKLCKSIKWESKKVLIDPYILGMWLGDGNSNGAGFTSEDPELIDYWEKYAETINCEIVLHKKNLKEGDKGFVKNEINFRPDICFGLKSKLNIGNDKSHINPFKYLLSKYKLIENKHIPDDYIYNDEETRMKLLAGFIDTDGFKARNAYKISQTSCRKHLIEQVKIIASSLGYQTSITKQDTKWKITNGEMRHGQKYLIHISGYNIDKIPVILKRKKIMDNPILDTLSSSITVKSIGNGKYNGFVIDKNHRFLLGDFTVTHNSGKAKHSTNGRVIKGLKERLTGKHLCSQKVTAY